MRISKSFALVTAGSALSLAVGIGNANAVSVLYFHDHAQPDAIDPILEALKAGPHSYTWAVSVNDFSTFLGSGDYDIAIFIQQANSGVGYTPGWTALATHLANGGGALAFNWTQSNDYAAPEVPPGFRLPRVDG